MIRLAEISTGSVTQIIEVADHIEALGYRRGWHPVTDMEPAPQVGWAWDGTMFHSEPPVDLKELRAAQVRQLSAACGIAIAAGFQSSALGSEHHYPADETDQRNQATAAITGGGLWCEADGDWTMVAHTPEQAAKVLADWRAHLEAQQARLVTLTGQVAAAGTADAIFAVMW